MELNGLSQKLNKNRRYRLCGKAVLIAWFVLATFGPILYVSFAFQPNSLNSQINSGLNVRQFQHSNKLTGQYDGEEPSQLDDIVVQRGKGSLDILNGRNDMKQGNQSKWIVKTHSANETLKHRLELDKLKRTHNTLCPTWPKELVGRILDKDNITNIAVPKEKLKHISNGGLFRPPNCTSREKVAIIIPCRESESQLQILLTTLHTVLQRQKIQYGIYVLEMAYPTQFNRGLLANVGFLTAASIADYTCVIIHDVDLVMMDDRNMYRCGRVPRHLVAYSSKYEDNLPYLSYFGGVSAFSTEQFWSVNGFSNLFFGWGGEDDDMVSRIISIGSHFSRPKKTVGGYVALKRSKETATPINPHRMALLYSSSERKDVDGVRTVKYSRLALEFKRLYTWVLISVKEAKIMEKYQDFLQVPEHGVNKLRRAQ